MAGINLRARTTLAGTISALLVILTAGCAHDSPTAAPSTPGSAAATSTPGEATAQARGVDLTVTHAVAHLDRSDDGTLTMTVRNDDGVPEHLGMVATPDRGRGTLVGGKSAKGNGMLDTAGILLLDGSSVTFDGDGPHVLLHHVHGITAQHTLPVVLQFGVAGLVRVRAQVTTA
ncbi:hypothetical protein [Streptomyces pseudovenezuelae]|uniref:Copper chaperone PCu(A)C n=1 Tax=Streptomyces pseudovenezuelae TaxID=67350 RepID=A0ABZ1X9S9_9ACTN|nr:hypothetical protein [Streptomyces pseudovenezuelae]